jgi:(p)ppGpp synthase/HD superfamily hydrolase
MTLAFDAMQFAREVHATQVRKYTGNPYTDHLAEVCGVAMSAGWHNATIHPDKLMAVAWLHDCVEDQGVTRDELDRRFGATVADGVMLLSDLETGNRATRKKASRERLAMAPGWVQTIKVADLISNTSSIVKHDPTFAKTYLKEKRLMLAALRYADERLLRVAGVQLAKAEENLLAHPA